MKKVLLLLVFWFVISTSVETQAQESINLVTYYPPPIAVSDRLKLMLRDPLPEPCDEGTLYVDTDSQIHFCKEGGSEAGIWNPLMGEFWKQTGDNVYPSETGTNPNLKVGIGTTVPKHLFHVRHPEYPERQMFFDGTEGFSKGAFRAGQADWTWNCDEEYSCYMGDWSVGIGEYGRAEGDYSIAIGSAGARGLGNIALGNCYTNDDDYNIVLGVGGTAGDNSTNLGHAIAIGPWAQANGYKSTAIGYSSIADGVGSFALGKHSEASGNYATSIGWEFDAQGDYSFAVNLDDTARILSQANSLSIMGGNVGIGMATPDKLLEIGDGSGVHTVSINKGDVDAGNMIQFNSGGTPFAAFIGEADEALTIKTFSGADELRFGVDAERVIEIEEEGKVGIGTGSPVCRLHIQNDLDLDLESKDPSVYPDDGVLVESTDAILQIFSENESATSSSICLEEVSPGGSYNDQWVIWRSANDGDNGSFYITYSSDAGWWIAKDAVFAITKAGYFGMGRKNWIPYSSGNAPVHPLEMAGGAYSDGTQWFSSSSRTNKKNIVPLELEESLEALEELQPVIYRYKNVWDGIHLGFISEDVPDLVAVADRRGVSSTDILATLVKVAQHQQGEIEELKKILDQKGK